MKNRSAFFSRKQPLSPLRAGFYLATLLLLAFNFSSCGDDFFSQTIEIDPPPYTKQLTFHLNLTDQDTAVELLLTRNFGILESVPNITDFYVGGGSVDLLKDGLPWLTLVATNPNEPYRLRAELHEPLQSGSTYEIRASHPDYAPVTASQLMPSDFQVDSARVKHEEITGPFGDKYDLIEVFMKDQAGVRNFYEVSISSSYYQVEYDPSTGMLDTVGIGEYETYPEDFSDPNLVPGIDGSLLFGDQFLDGQDYRLQVQVYGSADSKFKIRVRNVTEDYFRWSASFQAKLEAEDNPLVEPVSVFDNLIDGLGIFSLRREKVFEVQ